MGIRTSGEQKSRPMDGGANRVERRDADAEIMRSKNDNSLELSIFGEVIFKTFWRGTHNWRPLLSAKGTALGDEALRQLSRCLRA